MFASTAADDGKPLHLGSDDRGAYPQSDHVVEAERRLAGRRTELSSTYVAEDEVRDPLYVREKRVFAFRDATNRATAYAKAVCAPVVHGERLRSIVLEASRPECHAAEGGEICGLNFRARCHRDVRPYVDVGS